MGSKLKFIFNVLACTFAMTIFVSLVMVLSSIAMILLQKLGGWIGIGDIIFTFIAAFYIVKKVWNVLAWGVDKLAPDHETEDTE